MTIWILNATSTTSFQVEESSASFLPAGKRALPCRQRNKICHLAVPNLHSCLFIYTCFSFKCECDCMQRSAYTKQGAAFLKQGVACVVGSSVKLKCGFYGHGSSNSIIFFSLGDKPLSVILDCYHRLILVLISVWLTTPSALEDKVIHVRPHSPSCFAPFNIRCHEPCLAAVSFLHWFLRGLMPKSCFFSEKAGSRLSPDWLGA